MKSNKIHRSDTGLFSKQQLDMVYDQAIYKDFISQPFSIDAFEDQMNMKLKQYPEEFRKVLRDSLINQYDRVEMTTSTASNIDSILDNKTYTITTGHQLSLFTGPLYFIIKIVHVIKLCKELSKKYPQHRFVPVYWMASEDHDFKEIQSFHVFNKTITWNTNQKGPVGRFDLSGLDEVKTQLTELFVNHPDSEVMNLIDQLDGETYADVVRGLVNALFGSDGLVILDGDDVELKQLFAPIVQKELDEQFSFKEVLKLNDTLSALNVKLQVVPRETNLFYIENGIRQRIVQEGNQFVIDGVGVYSKEDIFSLLAEHPDRFSPNVILRPVYQEFILPNLAYVGGSGEIAYWLQLKGVFDFLEVPYPLIQVRNSIVWLDNATRTKFNKYGFKLEDLFKEVDVWKKDYVLNNTETAPDFSALETAGSALKDVLKNTIITFDPFGEQQVKAEVARLDKQLQGIKAIGIKKMKAQHENAMKAIEQIKQKLFPENDLQERHVNFFQFCADGNVQSRIGDLSEAIEPFSNDLILLVDDLH